MSDSKSSSRIRMEARQPDITLQALCDTHPNLFKSIAEEGEPPREAYESFVQLGEGLFGGTPRCRGFGAECFETSKELCTEGVGI